MICISINRALRITPRLWATPLAGRRWWWGSGAWMQMHEFNFCVSLCRCPGLLLPLLYLWQDCWGCWRELLSVRLCIPGLSIQHICSSPCSWENPPKEGPEGELTQYSFFFIILNAAVDHRFILCNTSVSFRVWQICTSPCRRLPHLSLDCHWTKS